MCAPCVEAARQRAALLNSEGIVPVDQRFNVTPMSNTILTKTPIDRPQVLQGDIVPVTKPPITIPQDVEQMRLKKAQTEDTSAKLAIKTIDTPGSPEEAD